MKDLFTIFGFLGILILFAFVGGNGGSLGTNSSNDTSPTYLAGTDTSSSERTVSQGEIEAQVGELYRNLQALKESEREKKLWGTPSPYRDIVRLSNGNAWSTDPDTEYLTLRGTGALANGINISDWYLESYVTKERAGIPQGDRVIEKIRSPKFEDIYLNQNEEMLLITGHSPIDVSFRENMCTGYLNEERDFIPPLGNRCVSPLDELKRYGKIKLDNDKCYDFIETLNTCEVPLDEDIPRGSCTIFSDATLNYNSCIKNHRNEPFFNSDGYWYIYFGRNDELWRSEREIIRLIDEQNRVVDVLEY